MLGLDLVTNSRPKKAPGFRYRRAFAALTAVTVVAILILEKLGERDRTGTPLVHWLQLALGVGDSKMARLCRRDQAIAGVCRGRLDGIGHPKILALVLAATASLAYLTLSSRQVVAVAILFVILGSSPIITLVIAHAIGGQATRARIELLKGFLLRNNNLILMVVFAMLGMSVLGNGVSGLR